MAIDKTELATELERRANGMSSLLGFTIFTMPTYSINWHHRIIANALDNVLAGKIKRLMLLTPPRHGKALALDTPIPTPEGWTAIGALKVGDFVFACDGTPTRVVALSEIWKNRNVFKVTTDTGQSLFADEAHEWLVRLDRKWKAKTIRETQWLAVRKSPRNPLVNCHPGLNLPERKLIIPPYTLGVWLGDGSSYYGAITQSAKDAIHVNARIESEGFSLRPYTVKDRCPAFGIPGLKIKLRELCLLQNKHIPKEYLRGSQSQRIALLQGLVDTDGYVAKDGQVEFCTIIRELADDVQELVTSLGVKASIVEGRASLKGVDCGPKYRVMFYFSEAASLPRKKINCKNGVKSPGHYLTFAANGQTDTICIEIEHPSHLFLAGKAMIPTRNTELVSKRFPSFAFGRDPDINIIATSYSDDLSRVANRDVQRIITGDKYHLLFPCTKIGSTRVNGETQSGIKNSDEFEVIGRKGIYKSSGIMGGITGLGFNVGIIDDPIKDRIEADSVTYRERLWEWYTAVFYTRRANDQSAIILVQTRWHHDDLAGRLLEADKNKHEWTVLKFEALKESEPNQQQSSVEEYDIRHEGEALWPALFSAAALKDIETIEGAFNFASLYQQRPVPRSGNMFKIANIKLIDEVQTDQINKSIRYWDKAGSSGSGCLSAGVLIHEMKNHTFVVGDVVSGQWGALERETRIAQTASIDGYRVKIWTEQEPGSGGKESAEATVRNLRGFVIRADRVTGDKVSRAEPFSSQVEAGNVSVLNRPWTKDYLEELEMFPSGKYRDRTDASSGAFNKLVFKRITPHVGSSPNIDERKLIVKKDFEDILSQASSPEERAELEKILKEEGALV